MSRYQGGGARTRQRKHALRVLFEMDINCSSAREVLEAKKRAGENGPGEFSLELLEGVTRNRDAIDRVITAYSEGWDLERMPLVDRNILRMALYELMFMSSVPPGATIDEAVELAKAFSTEDSGRFVNGLLGNVLRELEEGKKVLKPD